MKDKVTDAEIDKAIAEATPMRDPGVLDKHWKTLRELPEWDKKPPDRDYIVKDLLVAGKVGMLAGHGGRGKTFALTQLAISVATGRNWFGHPDFSVPKKGKVLLALGEEDGEELWRRIYYSRRSLGIEGQAWEDLQDNLRPLPLAGEQVTLLDGESYTEFYKNLESRITTDELRLIILDPLSRFASSDTETDNKAATTFITALERLTRGESKPGVIIAHHERKPNSDKQESQFGVRGSSGLVDGVRWVGRLGPAEDKNNARLVQFKVVKSNYTGIPTPIELQREAGSGILSVHQDDGFASPGRTAPKYGI